MKNFPPIILLLVLIITSIHPAFSQRRKKQMAKKTRILFVLDASGSMQAEWEGERRIDIARKVLSEQLEELKAKKDLEVGLRVYGHQYDRKLKNCTDSKLEVGFAANSFSSIQTKMEGLTPKGTTPIAYSLEKAANDFPTDANTRNVIIMITDGIESCDGDPCAISLALQKKNIFLRPFIIGLGIEDRYSKNFDCMGRFYNAKSIDQFESILDDIVLQTLGRTTITVELLDISNAMKEKDINMSFINVVTNESVYDYVHYRDSKGMTDTLEIDAILTYDLVVNTVPPVVKKDIVFKGGRHNTVKVKTPQGILHIAQTGSNDYSAALQAIMRKKGQMKTLTTHRVNAKSAYLVGNYDIEVMTLPRTYFSGVQIQQDKVTRLNIEQPGVLSITNRLKGIGSLYLINSDGSQEWIYNFEDNNAQQNIALQPGRYKLVFRTEEAVGSEFTVVKKFTIQSGKGVNVDLVEVKIGWLYSSFTSCSKSSCNFCCNIFLSGS